MGKDAPTLEETAAFLEAAQAAGPRDHALACLLALNGLEFAAICSATVEDLADADGQRFLHVSLTGGRPMPVPLSARTAAAIDEQLDGRAGGPLLLADDGGPLRPADAAAIVRRIVHAAGLGHRLG
jgi:integrase/recombinase XerD